MAKAALKNKQHDFAFRSPVFADQVILNQSFFTFLVV